MTCFDFTLRSSSKSLKASIRRICMNLELKLSWSDCLHWPVIYDYVQLQHLYLWVKAGETPALAFTVLYISRYHTILAEWVPVLLQDLIADCMQFWTGLQICLILYMCKTSKSDAQECAVLWSKKLCGIGRHTAEVFAHNMVLLSPHHCGMDTAAQISSGYKWVGFAFVIY